METKPSYAVVTCFARGLNAAVKQVLALQEEEAVFINVAGGGVPHHVHELERSLLVAIMLLGAGEVLVVGHQTCKMAGMEMSSMIDEFRKRGVPRQAFGSADLREWFGAFHSPAKNVQEIVEKLNQSPLIPHSIPIHGLLLDDVTGKIQLLIEGKPRVKMDGGKEVALQAVASGPARLETSSAREIGNRVSNPSAAPSSSARSVGEILTGNSQFESAPEIPADFDTAFVYLRQFLNRLNADNSLKGKVADLKYYLSQERDPMKFLQTLEVFAGQFEKERQRLVGAIGVVRSTVSRGLTANQLKMIFMNLFK